LRLIGTDTENIVLVVTADFGDVVLEVTETFEDVLVIRKDCGDVVLVITA
jgi:hypothetical protein